MEKLGGTDLKALPPPRFTLYFPNRISGLSSLRVVDLKDIPDPLTIGDSFKDGQ
jgi:hypothetical protein